ncbi:MAG: hypothetical protein ACU0GG_00490 [Paracoccaceae bacterium]
MVHDWILDVLTDLRNFASKNGLGVTEEQINQALVVVAKELDARKGIAQGTAPLGHVGEFSRSLAESRNT